MIIVEGPDGAGKTTLTERLSREYDLKVKRPQRGGEMPELPVRARVYHALSKAVQGHQPAKIYDRLFFSELVYGEVLRERVDFTIREQVYVVNVLRALECPIIFCMPGYENLEPKGPQMAGVDENLQKIYENYELFLTKGSNYYLNGLNVIEYDFTHAALSYDTVRGHVEGYLRRRQKREY